MFNFIPSKIYYWHFLVFLIVFRYFLVCCVNIWQYLYLTSDAVPSELASILTKNSWNVCRIAALEVFKFKFWESFASSISFLLLVGLGGLRYAWNGLDMLLRYFSPRQADFGNGQLKSILFFGIYELFTIFIITPIIFSWGNIAYDKDILSQNLEDLLLSSCQVFLFALVFYFAIRKNKRCLFLVALVILIFARRIFYAPIMAKLMAPWTKSPENQMIFDFLDRQGFPPENVFYERDFSNVSQTGIGRWSFILVGGRLESKYKQTKKEILAIVAHEIYHWIDG